MPGIARASAGRDVCTPAAVPPTLWWRLTREDGTMTTPQRILIGLALALTTSWAAAHGGGLDKNGCHHDRKTGTYHCHR